MNVWSSSEASGLCAHPGEPLEAHLVRVAERACARARELPIFNLLPRELLHRLAYIAGASHDLGKATTYFQRALAGQGPKDRHSQHALLSAVFGALWAEEVAKDYPLLGALDGLPAMACFIAIRRHHGSLRNALEDCAPSDNLGEHELLKQQWASVNEGATNHVLESIGAQRRFR